MMNLRAKLLFVAATLAACVGISGCSQSTAVSRQPSDQEIQEGIQRRIKAIDEDKNMSPEAKERAKQQVLGNRGAAPRGQ